MASLTAPPAISWVIVITGSLIALAAEAVMLMRAENNLLDFALGALFGTGIAVVACSLVPGKAEIGHWAGFLAVALFCFAALIGLAGGLDVLPRIGPPTAPGPHSTASGAPGGSVTLTSPQDGGTVQQCAIVSGTASLKSGQTLVLAQQNLDDGDPTYYFEPVAGFKQPETLSHWSGYLFFGQGESTGLDQHYRIQVLVMSLDTASQGFAKGNWFPLTLPTDAQVAQSAIVVRKRGLGPLACRAPS